MVSFFTGILRFAAGAALFSVYTAIGAMLWWSATQTWISLVEALQDAGGFMEDAGDLLGWIIWVSRLDYLLGLLALLLSVQVVRQFWWFVGRS